MKKVGEFTLNEVKEIIKDVPHCACCPFDKDDVCDFNGNNLCIINNIDLEKEIEVRKEK